MVTTFPKEVYTLDTLRDEVQDLVDHGVVKRQDQICILGRCFPAREWVCFQNELEDHDYFMRDHIIDLLSHEEWRND